MSRQEYVHDLIARGGGMITCGQHLGVMVGTDPIACPAGWVFVPIDKATVELVSEAMDHAQRGRRDWPPKENGDRPT